MGHDKTHANGGGQIAVAYRTVGDGMVYEEGDAVAPLTTGTDPNSNILAFAQNSRDEVRIVGGDGQVAGALASDPGMKQQTYVAAFEGGQGSKAGNIGYSEETAPTLSSAPSGTQQSPALQQGMAVRRLTVIECARLQGFPDTYLYIDYKRRKIDVEDAAYLLHHGVKAWQEEIDGKLEWFTMAPADGPMYKALGNSMATKVMCWLGKRVALVDAEAQKLLRG